MTWPSAAGIPNYTGSSSWGTSYSASNPIPLDFLATSVVSFTGSITSAHCAEWSASGVLEDSGSGCGSGGSSITLQTNGSNNASQTALNIENGQGIICSNPSSGNVQCVTNQPNRTIMTSSGTISCTTDSGSVILVDDSSAVAISVPQATGSCGSGFGFTIENSGAGTATVTPTTSTVNGLSALTVPTNYGCTFWSDGTNYQVAACRALSTLVEALGSVTTVTPNCAYQNVTATITGAATIAAPTGCTPYTGQRIFLDIQSASSETYSASAYITGSTTGSWPASSTGSSKDDHFELIYDGYLGTPGWTLAAYNLGL